MSATITLTPGEVPLATWRAVYHGASAALDGGRQTGMSALPTLRITIRDWGNGVNPATLPAKPHDPLKPGGVGLVCLSRLMDDVIFAPQKDGMLLTMVKRKS